MSRPRSRQKPKPARQSKPAAQEVPKPLPSSPARPVAIVGFASSSRHLAPVDKAEFEIWSMNHAPLSFLPRWDALFEMHTMQHLRSIAAHSTDPNKYMDWLKSQPAVGAEGHKPIYMQERFEDIPASVSLPRDEMNAWFRERGGGQVAGAIIEGYYADDYYTSTISYMVALALMQGRREIHLYGIDLLQDEEWAYQRSGCEYLIGFARGMGVRVYIPRESALCKVNYTYGYSEPLAGTDPERGPFTEYIAYVEDKRVTCETQSAKHQQDSHTYHGAVQALDLALGILAQPAGEKSPVEQIKQKRAEMADKFRMAQASGIAMEAQADAFKTANVWAKHSARGGKLVA